MELLVRCLIIICRNFDNIPFIASCDYVSQTVGIAATIIHQVHTLQHMYCNRIKCSTLFSNINIYALHNSDQFLRSHRYLVVKILHCVIWKFITKACHGPLTVICSGERGGLSACQGQPKDQERENCIENEHESKKKCCKNGLRQSETLLFWFNQEACGHRIICIEKQGSYKNQIQVLLVICVCLKMLFNFNMLN